LGLITKEVEVELNSRNIKWYKNLEYEIPKRLDTQNRLRVKKGTIIIVKVEDLHKGSHAKVDVECDCCGKELKNIPCKNYLKCVKEDGKYYCNKCDVNGNNKWLSFKEWCLNNNYIDVLNRWDYELNKLKPSEIASKTGKKYYFKCPIGIHKSELKHIANFTTRQKNSMECNKCNTIAITHPQLVEYFVNKEDAYKYSHGSEKNILMKCLKCGFEKKLSLNSLVRNGFSCPKCGDGISYPEKFIFNVLEQLLNNNFIMQLSRKTFDWCNNFRYDFYIDELNCIIETHGLQHYEETKNNWYNLREIQENDKIKEQLARDNNINNYIVLDCRESDLKWIKNSIMNSELPKLLNFKEEDIDWLKCHEYACSSLVKITCDYWNDGLKNTLQIANILKLNQHTIIIYLKQGAKIGWCDYDPKEEMLKIGRKIGVILSKKVICLTTNEIFNSITEASNKYNICFSSISECCRYERKSAGKYPVTGKKLYWMYYDEYLINPITLEEIKNNYKHNKSSVKVICLTTEEVFNSLKEGSNKYKINCGNVSKCCMNNCKSAGKHPETGEPLIWMYYEKYIDKQNNYYEVIV